MTAEPIAPSFFAAPSEPGQGWRRIDKQGWSDHGGVYCRCFKGWRWQCTTVFPHFWPKESRRELALNTIMDQPFF